jgi:hypothetical protein
VITKAERAERRARLIRAMRAWGWLPAARPVPDHSFVPVRFMSGCGHIPYRQADRCGRPRHHHRGVTR